MTLYRARCPKCGHMSHADKHGRMMCREVREYDEEKPIKVKVYKRKRTGSARVIKAPSPDCLAVGPDPDTSQLKLFGG